MSNENNLVPIQNVISNSSTFPFFRDFCQKRCIAINKNNKKCRSKTNNNSFFCCKSHEPINKELLEDGCFLCMEKIEKSNDIIYFNCKHIIHKTCYNEWLKYSTYDENICLLCRNIVFEKKNIISSKKSGSLQRSIIDTTPIQLINDTLYLEK